MDYQTDTKGEKERKIQRLKREYLEQIIPFVPYLHPPMPSSIKPYCRFCEGKKWGWHNYNKQITPNSFSQAQ